MREKIAFLVYSACGAGRAPIAPGTAGSAAAALALLLFGRIPLLPPWDGATGAAAIVVLFFAGVWATGPAERLYGRDPGVVVIDEVVGMCVALFLLPNSIPAVGAAFFLFRLFDIGKPPPARFAEKARGGWGVMLDDVVAGAYANLLLRVLLLARGAFS